MTQYIIRRLLLMIPTLLGVSLLVTGMVRLLPGDAVDILLAENSVGGGNETFVLLVNEELENPTWAGTEPVDSETATFGQRQQAEFDILAAHPTYTAKATAEGVNLERAEDRRSFMAAQPSAERLQIRNDIGRVAYENEIRSRLGVDKNYIQQWWSWVSNAVQGDLGTTIAGSRPVGDEMRRRLPASFQLGLLAMFFGSLIAIPTGIISAVRQDSAWDYTLRSTAIGMLALPSFFLATIVIAFSARWFDYSFPVIYKSFWADPWQNMQQVLTPAIILGFALSGTLMRLTRAQMLEVLRQDYIRTARAKGLGSRTVVISHATRNALLPVVTILGLQIPILVGGSLVLEQIFAIPGIAQYLFLAIGSREFPIIIAVNMVIAVVIVFSNLVVDVAYGFLDPRVQLN